MLEPDSVYICGLVYIDQCSSAEDASLKLLQVKH